MSRGPLPKGTTRRRNAPTIPTTNLPVGGYDGPIPGVPANYELGVDGAAWWRWAWRTPQAAAWDEGALYTLARRAQLEDDLAALARVEDFDFSIGQILGVADKAGVPEATRQLEQMMGKLKALAGGRVGVMREMRELDKRLGLDPKALGELRWKIVAKPDEAATAPAVPAAAPVPTAAAASATVRRLRAVDPAATG